MFGLVNSTHGLRKRCKSGSTSSAKIAHGRRRMLSLACRHDAGQERLSGGHLGGVVDLLDDVFLCHAIIEHPPDLLSAGICVLADRALHHRHRGSSTFELDELVHSTKRGNVADSAQSARRRQIRRQAHLL